jgi:ABC-2 type transport system ATP-binding protein
MLIDDCIILDYGKILLHERTDYILKNFRRFTFSASSDSFPDNKILWNTGKVGNCWETYSFAPAGEVCAVLSSGNNEISGLKEEKLSLEDAFIGLTGKY